ncbi:MerR HTH family regulatory protein [Caloramator fervidus]|uniref:MerR HTH family regulatory protein n=1 Tax=Caloramator fervidus TaxID=29344 RepID=A0A1H5SBU9_9CLOT|nr:helix-turn-helix domain-containing protein [Caloramator fervidus]SEF47267.1 MerR HTH family regulatory protein [Caloramator fervidus]
MEKYYTFKEVCEKTGYRSSAIRYYEKEFDLKIERDVNGRRIFKESDLNKLLMIKKLQDEGYTNQQIKKILSDEEIKNEVAVSIEADYNNSSNINPIPLLEAKLNEINELLVQLNQNVFSKERDILISENMKLKMELKQKCYEIMELKEKLRYERESKKGFLSRIFKFRKKL